MTILQDKDRIAIQERLAEMQQPVKLINFTQDMECQFCRETRQLLEELAALSDKLSLEVFDFMGDKEKAEQYQIDKIPATVIEGDRDYGIRFYGIPSGYEFSTLLQDILMVSGRDSGLAETTRQQLKSLKTPVHFQVFVTPTCPYCPAAVYLSHQFAMENEQIVADMVEATEFPHLSQRYGVRGVPKTVANDRDIAEGALPESNLLDNLLVMLQSG